MTSFARSLGRTIIEDSARRGVPMNDTETLILMDLLFAERELKANAEQVHADAMKASLVYAILSKRIEVTTKASVEVPALVFLAQLARGNPGRAVLLATVIAEVSDDGKKSVSLSDIVNTFPFNVPSEAVYESAWDLQKRKEHNGRVYDNALDTPFAWDASSGMTV